MKKLLLVVDYQTDFVNGALGFPRAEKLDSLIAKKIAQYRSERGDVAFPHCIQDTAGWTLYGETGRAAAVGDVSIRKSSFPSLELGNWLEEKEYDQIELVGLVSYMCVLSNAIIAKAALPEAEILIDAACTAGPDQALHEKCLDLMESLQMTVINR